MWKAPAQVLWLVALPLIGCAGSPAASSGDALRSCQYRTLFSIAACRCGRHLGTGCSFGVAAG
jgi:hypothetical protein